MATILNSKKSSGGSPYAYYTVEVTPSNRLANTINMYVKVTGHLASSSSSLGTGGTMGLNCYITLNGNEYGPITLKGTSTSWSGTSNHSANTTFTVTGLTVMQTAITSVKFRVSRTGSAAGDYTKGAALSSTKCNDIAIDYYGAPSYFSSDNSNITLTNTQTVTITSYDDSFTNSLDLIIGNDTYHLVNSFNTSSKTYNYSWTPPIDYAGYNTVGSTFVGTLRVYTSAGTTPLGYTDQTVTFTIPDNASTKPTFSITTSDTTGYNSSRSDGSLVQYKSLLSGSLSSISYKYSTSYKSANWSIYSGNTYLTSGAGTSFTWTPTVIGTLTIYFTLTDNRNFSTTNYTTINVSSYSNPSSYLSADRDDIIDTTINCIVGGSSTNIADANRNATTYTLQYKKVSDNTWTTANTWTGYSLNTVYSIINTDDTKSYDIKLIVEDQFSSIEKNTSVQSSFTLMNFNTNGKALAIGKVSEASSNEELFEVALTTEISKFGNINGIYFNENGYGDKFRIIPAFSGVDDDNKLKVRGAVGGAGTDPSEYDLATLSGKSGHFWAKGHVNSDDSMEAAKGFWSTTPGSVNTAVGNSTLVIKQALSYIDGTPQNGVVLEYGNSTIWSGQLLITDNANDGIWFNGWYNGTRGSWRKLAFEQDVKEQPVLFNAASYMNAGQRADLSQKISEQKTGIVLIFSGYSDDSVKNYNHTTCFVPKTFLNFFSGGGIMIPMGGSQGVDGSKYIYIYDDHLEGNAANVSGNNGKYVLSQVVGV